MPALSAVTLVPDLHGASTAVVYLVVFTLVFVESGLLIGFFLPGDTVLFTAGVLAAEPGTELSLPWLMVGVFLAATIGDSVGYATGARLGRPWLQQRAEAGRLDPAHLARAEQFYARAGSISVAGARWIPWLRTLVPVLAGTSGMAYRRFVVANIAGALTWGVGLLVIGYASRDHPAVRWAAYAIAGVSVAVSLGALVRGGVRRRRPDPHRPGTSDGPPDQRQRSEEQDPHR